MRGPRVLGRNGGLMVTDTFAHVAVAPGQLSAMQGLRDLFSGLEEEMLSLVPEGRRRSLALTCLEQAGMWTMAAISKDWEREPTPLDPLCQGMPGQAAMGHRGVDRQDR